MNQTAVPGSGVGEGVGEGVVCANCGAAARDRFCPACGQRTGPRLVALRTLIRDALEDLFSIEARLPRTLATLLVHPGRLTREYAAGRVVRYVPPFRLYLTAGLVFFVAISFVASFDRLWRSAGMIGGEEFVETGIVPEGVDFVIVNVPVDTVRTPRVLRPIATRYLRQQDRLNAMPAREATRIVYGGVVGNASLVILLLVPWFAGLLKLLYPGRFYVEHVVFVLHLNAGLFLLSLPIMLGPPQWVWIPIVCWMLVYVPIALRTAFSRGWLASIAAAIAMVVAYAVTLFMVLWLVILTTVLLF
jgi:hypothetical protein